MNKKNKECGFYIIEIIAILIILGIIVTLALSRYMSQQAYESIPQTEMFKSHLRYAQQLSLNGDGTNTWGIQIGAGTTSYSLVNIQTVGYVVTVTGKLPGESGSTHNFPNGVTLTGVNVNQIIGLDSSGHPGFDQWGSPGASNITINVIEGSVTSSFTITGNTGFIK